MKEKLVGSGKFDSVERDRTPQPTTAKALHRKAMKLYEDANSLLRKGNVDESFRVRQLALFNEQAAADLLRDRFDAEPSRSLLYQSAASMALQMGNLPLARRLIETALSGNPPSDIAEVLRSLLTKVSSKSSQEQENVHPRAIGLEVGPQLVSQADQHWRLMSVLNTAQTMLVNEHHLQDAKALFSALVLDRNTKIENLEDSIALVRIPPNLDSYALSSGVANRVVYLALNSAVRHSLRFESVKLVNSGHGVGNNEDDSFLPVLFLAVDRNGKIRFHLRHAPGDDVYDSYVPAPDWLALTFKETVKRLAQYQPDQPAKTVPLPKRTISVEGTLLFVDAISRNSSVKILTSAGKAVTVYLPVDMIGAMISSAWNTQVQIEAVRKRNKLYATKPPTRV